MILVVFLAGYLSENRPLLVEEYTRVGPLRLPPVPYLAPMVAMWAIALGIVIVQRDLGAALLFFAVFLLLLYVATARVSFVVLGLAAFIVGRRPAVLAVRSRPDPHRHLAGPLRRPAGAGYQVVQALHAFARGGLIGTGLGNGLPSDRRAGRRSRPSTRTSRSRRSARSSGLVGILADPRAVPRAHRARAADRGGGRRTSSGRSSRPASRWSSASRRSSSRPAT